MAPTPDDAVMHCIALFPDRQDVLTPLLSRMAEQFPDFQLQVADWTEARRPELIRFGPLQAGGWAWHLLHDCNGLPEGVARVMNVCRSSPAAAIGEHQAVLMLFLVEAKGMPLPIIKSFCEVARHLLALGATVLAWPEGRRAWHRDELDVLDPSRLEAADFPLVVNWGYAGPAGKPPCWLRTYGLGQFHLPEIACPLPARPGQQESEVKHFARIFEHVPPYLIDRNDWLKVGEWIEVVDQTWDVVRWADKNTEPFLQGRYGAMCYVRRGSELQV